MQFARLVWANFNPPLSEPLTSWRVKIGIVDVEMKPIKNAHQSSGASKILMKAMTPIPFPTIDSAGFIIIPSEQRVQCENALQNVVDLVAVFSRRSRSILSSFPCWCLITEEPEELKRLNETKGVLSELTIQQGIQSPIPRDEVRIQSLTDRLIGVAILAESLSHSSNSGRYRDLVRFFEYAFALDFVSLGKKLLKFLLPAMGYTKTEIQHWCSLRHPMTHADGKITTELAFDLDVRRIIQRMDQAALDVLFNKTEMLSPSVCRRSVWIPEGMTTSEVGRGLVRQGSKGQSIVFQAFDDFGVFASDLETKLEKLPETWWSRNSRKDNTEETAQR